jgi:hypothetical protein
MSHLSQSLTAVTKNLAALHTSRSRRAWPARPAWPVGPAWLAALAAAACVLSVASCGGGVGSEGTGSSPISPASFASGPIAGFGSVIVNGVRFDDSAARVEDGEGALSNSSALRLGMVVDVDAGAVTTTTTAGVTTATATANTIRFGSLLLGPVAANNLATKSLTVLGHTVVIGAGTVFDERLSTGQAGLQINQVLEVHGLYDSASNAVVATRIEPVAGLVTQYRLRGVVRALDAPTATLQVGAAMLRYGNLALPPGLAVGNYVRLALATQADSLGRWTVAAAASTPTAPLDRAEAELRGVIDAFTSSASFRVNGIAVNAANAAFPDGTAGLRAGARVQAKGSLRQGVLVASTLKVDSEDSVKTQGFEFKGSITSVNLAAQTLVIRGNTVSWADPALRIDNGTLADIKAGSRVVEIKGQISADGTRLVAQRLKFED